MRYQLAKQMKAFQLVEQPTGMQQISRFASYFYGGEIITLQRIIMTALYSTKKRGGAYAQQRQEANEIAIKKPYNLKKKVLVLEMLNYVYNQCLIGYQVSF